MKQFLVEIDDACARDLERVAPAKDRRRAEFVRLAIRQAIDAALDRATERAYRDYPLGKVPAEVDLAGWDERNLLARAPARATRRGQAPRARPKP